MCGIAGIVRWGKLPIEEEQVAILLVGNEHRGNDASGIAIQQADGAVDILKKDVPGWQLVSGQEYADFIVKHLRKDSRCVLIHARAATTGNPRDNNNNHPMFAGHSAVVHNGVARNHEVLFGRFKYERKAETDSDIFRAILDAKGLTQAAIEQMCEVSGSGAIAAIHSDYRDKLLLVRSGNPLVLASNEDFLFFSSEKATLHKACRPFIQRHGILFQAQQPNVAMSNMPQHTAWILGPEKVEVHMECKICAGEYQEPWRKVYEEYSERQRKWNSQASEPKTKPAWCSKCDKFWTIPYKEYIYGNYHCNKDSGGCGGALASPHTKPGWNPPRVN